MPDKKPSELTLVSTEDMVDEIKKRHKALIIGAFTSLTEDECSCYFFYEGAYSDCIFLTEKVKYELFKDHEKTIQDDIR